MFSLQPITMFLALATLEPVAAPEDNRAQAAVLFRKGVVALEAQRFDEAIDHYTKAYLLLPTVTVLSNLALAHDLAGHRSEALASYRKLDREAEHAREEDLIKLRNNLVKARERIPILEAELAAEAAKADKQVLTVMSQVPPDATATPGSGALPKAPAVTRPATREQQSSVLLATPAVQTDRTTSAVASNTEVSSRMRWWPVAVGAVAIVAAGTVAAFWLGRHECRGDLKCF